MSASFEMAHDADEAMPESSWTALAKEKERDWWSVDLEGDVEKLEVVGPWSGTEDGSVDPTRKMSHEESEKPKETEMEMDGDVRQEESVEIQSPKRKVIRAEEETQDYVRETLAFSQEEAEKMGFVPSALGEPRGPIFWSDNRCSEKAIRYWLIASMVIEEGGEARTTNLCQQCYNENLAQQGQQSLKLWQWRIVVEKKAHRGRIWKVMGKEHFLRGMWEYFVLDRAEARKILAVAAGTPFKEVLEQVKRSADADCGPQMMRHGYLAMKNGSWEEFKEGCRKEGKVV